MKTYKLNFLEFVRTRFCIIIYIAVNAAIALTSIYGMFFDTMSTRLFVPSNLTQIQALSFSEHNLRFTAIVFIMFLFTSHYYFSQARKSELLESASVTVKGKNGFYLNQFAVMLTLALITCGVTFLLSIIFSFKDPSTDGAYFLHCAKISILYFFLADIIAILIGFLCSTIKKTAAAYIILVICSFLFSPLTSRLTGEIYNRSDESIYPLWRIFEIYPKTFSYNTVCSGVNANIKSLSIIVFWISLFSIIAIFTVCSFRAKSAKQIAATVCLIVFAASGAGTLMPYSTIPNDLNSVGSDADYYVFREPESFVIQKNEEPNFEIKSYDMNFKIKNELTGNVTVKVDNPNLTEYHFTLYYGYKLKSVTGSNDEELKYDRDGDYITVHTDAPTESLNFKYKGFSQIFYSNSQSSNLLGGFAYYPINGFRYVYSVSDQGNIRTKLSSSVPMSVKVDCGKKMFSNLESTGKNTFEGTSDSLTLVSGFYKELSVDGTRMIYPYYDKSDGDSAEDYEAQLKMLINKKPKYKGKTIILSSSYGNSADARIFVASDQVLASNILTLSDDTQEEFLKEMGDPKIKNDYFFAFLKYYDKDSELYKLTQQDPSTLPDDSDDLNVILAKKIIEYKDDDSFLSKFTNAMQTSGKETAQDYARNVGVDEATPVDMPY